MKRVGQSPVPYALSEIRGLRTRVRDDALAGAPARVILDPREALP
jgi:hypothetical protein